ncbi:hypothetical protein H920_01074 [Fukomys damarensis]|uniref:Uncharacterized protein n=1 Tax=Fukomys damarensis TaxID=885580 RepID=A0A091E4K6_FUKDA|nr:hypothetical protein H920_01074 [Fukomys damarensis]
MERKKQTEDNRQNLLYSFKIQKARSTTKYTFKKAPTTLTSCGALSRRQEEHKRKGSQASKLSPGEELRNISAGAFYIGLHIPKDAFQAGIKERSAEGQKSSLGYSRKKGPVIIKSKRFLSGTPALEETRQASVTVTFGKRGGQEAHLSLDVRGRRKRRPSVLRSPAASVPKDHSSYFTPGGRSYFL